MLVPPFLGGDDARPLPPSVPCCIDLAASPALAHRLRLPRLSFSVPDR